MTKISVNINKIALIRNSREKNHPDILQVATDLLKFGVHGITIHPRPDGRHIRQTDVSPLSKLIAETNRRQNSQLEFNIEGYPSEDFLKMVEGVETHQATLVPDPPEALTSNAGWDFVKNKTFLTQVCLRLKKTGIRVSLFLDPATMNEDQWQALKEIGCDRIELYTEAYADAHGIGERNAVIDIYKSAATRAQQLGLKINAGHDLNLENLGPLIQHVHEIEEVSIGHALISEALYLGFKETISRYLDILKRSHAI